MKKLFGALFLSIFVAACSSNECNYKPVARGIATSDTSVTQEKKSAEPLATPDQNPSLVVIDFLKWYKSNQDSIYKINTISGGPAGVPDNETPENYYVDFKEVEKYLTTFRNSGCVSEKYLEQTKQDFMEGDKNFKEHPANDGPPDGFDYDHVLLTQDDYDEDWRDIDKIPFVVYKQTKTTADVRFNFPHSGMKYSYILSRQNSKWLIDSIKNISEQ